LRIYFRPGGEGKFAGVCDTATSRGFAPKSRHSFFADRESFAFCLGA